MFQSLKDKMRGYSKEAASVLKVAYNHLGNQYYHIVKEMLMRDTFKMLPHSYQTKFYHTILSLINKREEYDYIEFADILSQLNRALYDEKILSNVNYLAYLNILLDYPEFCIFDSKLIVEEKNEKMLTYLRIEAKLQSMEDDLFFILPEFEDIVLNEKLRVQNLTDVIINGIINTHLSKYELVEDISYLLAQPEDYISLILKLFQAPTSEYNYLIFHLLKDREVVASGHLLEMVDMIYATPAEDLKELEFKITHKLIYEEMSFSEASRMYHKESMKVLDETPNMKSYTRVRIPIYIQKN